MAVDYLLSVWFKMFRFCLLLCCVFFSFFVFAGDCVEVDGRFQLRFNGDSDDGCSSSDGLVIYSNAVSSNGDFLRANNDGFTVSLTFDRDADALVPGDDIILFGVYGDYAASVVLMEVGIKSNGELFYNHPDEKFSRLLTDDVAMVNPHSLVISYSENERVVRVMVDGREITQSNVDAIDVDVRRITIGENFSGRMAPITGFDRRFTVSERFYESDRLSNVYNVPVIPLDVVDGVKRSEGLCLDDQVGQDKVCLLAANVLSSAPFSNFRTPDGATIDPPESGSVETFLSCDPGYTPSDPAPSYIVDSNGDITFNGGSCTLDQCNVINIPAYFSTITSPLSYGSNQLFTCDAGYVGSTSLNCTDGSAIDMSGNTDCNAVSTIGEITTYINALIAASTTIDNSVRQSIKDASSVVDATIDSTIDAILAGSTEYDCVVSNIPAYFSTITSPINFGVNNYNCDAGYVGSTSLNCTDGSAIDMSGNTDCNAVSTIGEITTYINALIAASTTIDNSVRQSIKDASSVVDATIDSTIDAILAGSTEYDCVVSNIPAYFSTITSPINFGVNNYNCDAGYVGSTSLNCTDGSTIDMSGNTDCNAVSTTAYNAGDTLVFNDFNSNVTGWTRSGGNARRVNNKMRVNHDNWVEKTFDFGVANANKSVRNKFTSITTSSDSGGWEDSGGNIDYFYIHYNGTQVFSTSYDGKNTTRNHNRTYNLNGSGQITIRYRINTSGSDEHLYIENFELEANEAMYSY